MYVKVNNGVAEYYAIEDIRIDHPNVSFPQVITNEMAAEFGVYPCEYTSTPAIDYTKNFMIGPPEEVDGAWRQTWIVADATDAEIERRLQDQWDGVRADRNSRLTLSDWTQLPDAPIDSAAWASYRQALRDITTQSDPFNIIWPEQP